MKKQIILASISPRRKEILKITGLPFIIVPSNFEEKNNLKMTPLKLAKHLSEGKARDVAIRNKNALVIAADTFISFEGKILGKPSSKSDARKMLKKLSGKAHSVITGFAIIDCDSGKTISRAIETKVYFKELSKSDIEGYVASKEPFDKSGSYGIQGLGSILIDKIEGEYFNVVGLPLASLVESLKEFGIDIWKENNNLNL